jgi:outer membrane protein
VTQRTWIEPSLTVGWRYGHQVSLLAIILLAAGCVNQEKEIGVYRSALEGHAPTSVRPVGLPYDAGTTLTLSEAMAIASRDSERLAISGEGYLQALIDKDRAFANFLPTVSLSPVYFARERVSHDPGPTHTFDVPIVAQADLRTISDIARLKGSQFTAEQVRELLLDLESATLLEVAQTYYAVLKADRSVEVLANSLAVQEERVKDVRDKLGQGVARKLDLEQSKAQAAATRVKLTVARREVVVGRATLARLIGVPYVHGSLVDAYVTPEHVGDLNEFLLLAREHRRDIIAAQKAVLASRQGIEAAVGQYYPSVSVNLQAFLYREAVPEDSHFTSFLQANVPLFAAGRIRADVREAWSRFRQSRLAESLLVKQVAEQAEIARIDFATSVQQVEDLRTEVAAAREAFRISGESYNQGLATNLDRLDAQDRLLSAELQLIAEGFDKTVYYLALLRVTGQLDGGDAGMSPPESPASAPVAMGKSGARGSL